jgi:hypothetical protein
MKDDKSRRELEARTRKELIEVASDLKVVGRHRMSKQDLIEAIVIARMYQALPHRPESIQRLTRRELLRLCELIGIEAKRNLNKGELLDTIEAALTPDRLELPRPRIGEQEKVETATLRTPVVPLGLPGKTGDLPEFYGETRVVVLPVDPYRVHIYWDVTPVDLEKAMHRLGTGFSRAQAALRFYDITYIIFDGTHAHCSFDVDIELQAKNWYVSLWSPEKAYCVDLLVKAPDGRSIVLARSNVAETPRAWPSLNVEDRYMRIAGEDQPVAPLSGAVGVEPHPSAGSAAPPEMREEDKPAPEAGAPEQVEESRVPGLELSRKETPGERKIEGAEPGAVDSLRILREKLAPIYARRIWRKPRAGVEVPMDRGIHLPANERRDPDLTEMSERTFTFGLSS